MSDAFTTGDALFLFDEDLTIRLWNAGAEDLTGIGADEALGRPCWDVLAGVDESGALVCHRGCSSARLARQGWPVRCHEILIKTTTGRRRVSLSTIALMGNGPKAFLHLMRERRSQIEKTPADNAALTPRQLEVLELIADGVPAKAIGVRLGITVATVRNHIRSILVELGAHSQLEAVAKARQRGQLEN